MADTDEALGGIASATDNVLTMQSSKLDQVKPASEEGFYMLAADCFDLTRKLLYMYKATRSFATKADPKLAQEILSDHDYLNAATDWETRARRAEKVMLRLYKEIHAEYQGNLPIAARGDSQPTA
ncbi:MAG: hypothetical protein HY703_08945 [Gemmatimonadetes bacterium]|nr:hypothetical protein [Gemmatimonadota bacterium]